MAVDETTPARPTREQLMQQRKQRAMLLSIGTAATLMLVKGFVAGITGSVAVLSEAAHSLTDLIAASLIFYSVRHAGAPPDSRHRYGHEKVEDFSAAAEGALITIAIGYVMFTAVERMASGAHVEQPLLATGVMAAAAVVNFVVAWHLRRVARETESVGVFADAQQLMGDVYTSAAVAIGLALVVVTGEPLIDPIVALVGSFVVLRVGLRLFIGSARTLLDESLPADELEQLEGVLREMPAGVTGYHRLRTRKAGSRRHIDLHLTMRSDMPLWQAHHLAHQVEEAISARFSMTDVMIHIEPATEAPPPGEDVGPSDER